MNKRVVALSAGTAAVHLALIACGVQPGDEVIVQSFTFCASSHPITYLGAKPIFVDSEKDSWNIDPELMETAIKDRIAKTGKKPKAIVQGAVGGAAGVVHASDSAHTDCEPNDNVEALRVWLDQRAIEARPLWKPMHKQPVYQDAPAYVNGVSETLFKVGMCLPSGPYVSDEDVKYIVNCIKEAIV